MFRVMACAAAVALSALCGAARADETILYEPPAPWVTSADVPAANPHADGPIDILSVDMQTHVGADGVETYTDQIFQVRNEQGLTVAGTLIVPWDPATQTLVIHRAQIIRGAQTIDIMAGGDRFMVLRQETELSRATLNGRLTANRQVEGLQVGDIVRLSVTLRSHDPVLAGHAEDLQATFYPAAVDRLRHRVLFSPGHTARWRAPPELGRPVTRRTALGEDVSLERRDVPQPTIYADAPTRYNLPPMLEVTDYAGWQDVSRLFMPLFRTAATLRPDSPLQAEITRIRTAYATPRQRAAAALQLVEQQVRYFAVAANGGGLTPAGVDQTWTRRYGDCKGKTALLLALLTGLGIEAEPALVSTNFGDGLDQRLPAVQWFDHVILRATIDGQVFWLDGTRLGDRDLDTTPPDFHWALPVRAEGATLEALPQTPAPSPSMETIMDVDSSTGLDAPTHISFDIRMHGDVAQGFRAGVAGQPRPQLQQAIIQRFGLSEIQNPEFILTDQPNEGSYLVHIAGTTPSGWGDRGDGGRRELLLPGSSVGVNFPPRTGAAAPIPYSLPYPMYMRQVWRVHLPRGGQGFEIVGDDGAQTIGPIEVHRTSRLDAGVANIQTEIRYLASEISPDQAHQAQTRFAALPIASDVIVRATHYEMTADEASALVARSPADVQPRLVRARVYEHLHQDRQALADLDTAVRLAPSNAEVFEERSGVRSTLGDHAGALADADAAVRLSPNDSYALRLRATRHDELGQTALALADLDTALQAEPASAESLNARCWIRAIRNVDLAAASRDCEQALHLAPSEPMYLDSRAFLNLRQGHLPQAITDYDAALSHAPHQAASLYGRGIAKLRGGDMAGGRADIAAALVIDPTLTQSFEGWGMTPPAGSAAPAATSTPAPAAPRRSAPAATSAPSPAGPSPAQSAVHPEGRQ
jgi:tetratricopeptide (TPR) repeat protein